MFYFTDEGLVFGASIAHALTFGHPRSETLILFAIFSYIFSQMFGEKVKSNKLLIPVLVGIMSFLLGNDLGTSLIIATLMNLGLNLAKE